MENVNMVQTLKLFEISKRNDQNIVFLKMYLNQLIILLKALTMCLHGKCCYQSRKAKLLQRIQKQYLLLC